MNTHYFLPSESCNPGAVLSLPGSSGGEDNVAVGVRNTPFRAPPLLMRTLMRMSRARWFSFLRRVFHYQNGSRSDLGSNPFNSCTWMMLDFLSLLVQISIITYTLTISKSEKPIWPMRIWLVGHEAGCFLSLLLLCGHYRNLRITQRDGFGLMEQQSSDIGSRHSNLMNKCRTLLDLFFAIWFVMGTVWVFDSRLHSFELAPKLHALCISLLAWNAVCYSFPFLLFLMLCCCVPLISNYLGYNMNMGSANRGACDDQIYRLPSWRYEEIETNLELGDNVDYNSVLANEHPECCICLTKYRDKEEVRQLPCSHIFHMKCVDQWLRIISCCPLCKQELER